MLFELDKENATTVGRWDILPGNAGRQDGINKEKEEDKGVEETFVGREEEETT
jgi:hypothetical protein